MIMINMNSLMHFIFQSSEIYYELFKFWVLFLSPQLEILVLYDYWMCITSKYNTLVAYPHFVSELNQ